MTKPTTERKRKSALDARADAQRLAFAPIAFQAAKSLRDLGILKALETSAPDGLTLPEVAETCKVPEYGVRVLLEAGLGSELVYTKQSDTGERWLLDRTGYFMIHDQMTVANMDFTQDVCYRPMESLSESVLQGKPVGLAEFGEWDTVYQALSSLEPQVQKSWFAFDHLYSDQAFPEVIGEVMGDQPASLLDIGGNTGKWAIYCAQNNPDVHITIADLPGQLEMAKKNVAEAGFSDRVSFIAVDLLDDSKAIPGKYDAIWMSQFLDCFSEVEIVSILSRCREALSVRGQVYILEHFWDQQPYEAGSFSLQMTSLYFTAIANGNSQMYRSTVFLPLVEQAGLQTAKMVNGTRWGHTLLKCKQ